MVLNEDDMFQIVFDTIREKPGEKTAITLMKNVCEKIKEKGSLIDDTNQICDNVCDDVINCMTYYNDFINEKKMNLPVIGETYFSMVKIILEAINGEMLK